MLSLVRLPAVRYGSACLGKKGKLLAGALADVGTDQTQI